MRNDVSIEVHFLNPDYAFRVVDLYPLLFSFRMTTSKCSLLHFTRMSSNVFTTPDDPRSD